MVRFSFSLRHRPSVAPLARAAMLTASLLTALALAAAPDSSLGADADPTWEIAMGGRLYDRWYQQLMTLTPPGRHPRYEGATPTADVDTWRCVSCHGWDYRGVPSMPGRLSLLQLRGAEITTIEAAIIAPRHGFTRAMLGPIALRRLALFVSAGQMDIADAIDPATQQVSGDWRYGAWLYGTACAVSCHGFAGDETPLEQGNLTRASRSDPYRAFHKIRFGEPDTGMIALTRHTRKDILDLLAFIQTIRP